MTLKTPGENGRTAAGAEVTAYLIAKATFTSRGIDYVLDDDFAETRLDLDDNITQSMVDDLVKYAGNNNITGISERSGEDGGVVFDGLTAGVYLIAAKSLPEGLRRRQRRGQPADRVRLRRILPQRHRGACRS